MTRAIAFFGATIMILGTASASARSEESATRPAVVLSAPQRDASGIVTYKMTSPHQPKPTTLRILAPRATPNPARQTFLFVLPVVQGLETKDAGYGDGLAEIRALGLHEKHNLVVVWVGFAGDLPWYYDHPTDPGRADETYLIKDVLPEIDRLYPTREPVRLLIGFSKSGWGAFTLILRHPDLFRGAAAFDAPLMMDKWMHPPRDVGADALRESFQKNRVDRLLADKIATEPFRKSNRLALCGNAGFTSHMVKCHQMMTDLRIQHTWLDKQWTKTDHSWRSGWVEGAVELLVRMGQTKSSPDGSERR